MMLFVCTGNLCRSPMAAAYFARRAGEAALPGWSVDSAGVWAPEGAPASPLAIRVAQEFGVDLTPHRARRLDRGLVRAADWIVVMEPEHRDYVLQLAPEAAGRTHLLAAFDPEPGPDSGETRIEDPIQAGIETYRRVFARICRAVDCLVRQLATAQA